MALELTGDRFGRLIVVGRHGSRKWRSTWLCRCDCGGEKVVRSDNLRNGDTRSCGCLTKDQGEAVRARNTKHGMFGTPEYVAYHTASARCRLPTNPAYSNYGARGIEFRFGSFEQFFAIVGLRPSPQHSLDRIDNDGHYEPGNVRWATAREQMLNRRHCQTCTCRRVAA